MSDIKNTNKTIIKFFLLILAFVLHCLYLENKIPMHHPDNPRNPGFIKNEKTTEQINITTVTFTVVIKLKFTFFIDFIPNCIKHMNQETIYLQL